MIIHSSFCSRDFPVLFALQVVWGDETSLFKSLSTNWNNASRRFLISLSTSSSLGALRFTDSLIINVARASFRQVLSNKNEFYECSSFSNNLRRCFYETDMCYVYIDHIDFSLVSQMNANAWRQFRSTLCTARFIATRAFESSSNLLWAHSMTDLIFDSAVLIIYNPVIRLDSIYDNHH